MTWLFYHECVLSHVTVNFDTTLFTKAESDLFIQSAKTPKIIVLCRCSN